ncbi:MAG TPA: hypothetical protein VFT66_14580 [Roseiflexaceae bacterium]|jgi:hypothetical protein|nr:hypothetical protein [Roseiflexaceae bacterium]
MRDNISRKVQPTLPLYLACYALWLGLAVLALWLIFQIQAAMFDLAIAFRFNPWQVRALDQFGIVTMGLIWLVCIFILEHWLRQGMLKQRLWRRAALVLVVEVVVLGLCYAVQALFG